MLRGFMGNRSVYIRPSRSAAALAILTLLMIAVSYIFILGIAAACVYLPALLLQSDYPGFYQLALFLAGLVIAGTLLWSLVPRADKFTPTGFELDRSSQPRLFAELDRMAGLLNEPLPEKVYLTPDVEAWVGDRGGIAGFNSHRVMGIGLPLLSILNVVEFRSVLAHEFAHYYSGDTRLGPWVYKTRSTILRAFENTMSLGEWRTIAAVRLLNLLVRSILRGYLILFVRATNWVSRKQEFRADELACIVGGSEPFISGLRAIHTGRPAWWEYWHTEVMPMLDYGGMPPIGDGFIRFINAPEICKQIEKNWDYEMNVGSADPHDTHPAMVKRIEAVRGLGAVPEEECVEPALGLLEELGKTEFRLVQAAAPKVAAEKLSNISWDDAGAKLIVPAWEQALQLLSTEFQGISVEKLPEQIPQLRKVASRIPDPPGMLLSHEQRLGRARQIFGAALAIALLKHGWELHCQPGELYVHRGIERINPFLFVNELIAGQLSGDAWVTRCRELAIGEIPMDEGVAQR
jgi:heat shock protein HtpX